MRLEEERRVARRAEYIAATTDLRDAEAEAVARSEEGYSHSGIADTMGTTEGTVATYHDRATARYGPSAVGAETKPDRTGEEDLNEVTVDGLRDLSGGVRQIWHEAAQAHPEFVPDDVAGLVEDGTGGDSR